MDSSVAGTHFPLPKLVRWRLIGWITLSLLSIGYAVLIAWNMGAWAAGADASGYLNSARLIRAGKLEIAQRAIPGLPPEKLPGFSYIPLGFIPAHDDSMVPTYPFGFSALIVGVSKITGWEAAPHVTMWLHALAGVALMFALARVTGFSTGAALCGALLLATSSLYLKMSLQAMSDVPALVWTAAAMLFAWLSRRRPAWALAAGAAVAVAVLVRPSNLLVMAPVALCLGFSWRCWLLLAVGGAPGAVLLAWINYVLYGGALRTGYGSVGSIFAWENVPPALVNYAETFPIILTPGIVLVLALPWFLRGTDRFLAAVLTIWIVVFTAFYAFYFHTHEAWWYLRFVMPVFPGMILALLLAARTFTARLTENTRRFGFIVTVLAVVIWQFVWVFRLPVLESGRDEKSYRDAAQWITSHVPSNAVLLTMQTSGAMFFYTDLPVVRYDQFNAVTLETLERGCQAQGRPLYAALFPFELQEALETHLPGRWTQVAAVQHITIWRQDGSERSSDPIAPWHVLIAARDSGQDAIVKAGAGWFGTEHTFRHNWTWCGGNGRLDVETSPAEMHAVRLAFGMRSLVPRTVTITQNGAILWQGGIGLKLTPIALSFSVSGGSTQLELTTDAPAVPEASDSGARHLAFAIYDPRLTLPGSER